MQDTIELATYFNVIQSPSQGYFQVVDPDTGEILTDKIHGMKNLKPYFEEHVDIWRKIYDKVYELLSKKENSNIVSYERMLNIDVNELFGLDVNKENS